MMKCDICRGESDRLLMHSMGELDMLICAECHRLVVVSDVEALLGRATGAPDLSSIGTSGRAADLRRVVQRAEENVCKKRELLSMLLAEPAPTGLRKQADTDSARHALLVLQLLRAIASHKVKHGMAFACRGRFYDDLWALGKESCEAPDSGELKADMAERIEEFIQASVEEISDWFLGSCRELFWDSTLWYSVTHNFSEISGVTCRLSEKPPQPAFWVFSQPPVISEEDRLCIGAAVFQDGDELIYGALLIPLHSLLEGSLLPGEHIFLGWDKICEGQKLTNHDDLSVFMAYKFLAMPSVRCTEVVSSKKQTRRLKRKHLEALPSFWRVRPVAGHWSKQLCSDRDEYELVWVGAEG